MWIFARIFRNPFLSEAFPSRISNQDSRLLPTCNLQLATCNWQPTMTDYSFIANAHPSYIDSLYEQFQDNPDALDESWRLFFRGFDYGFKEDGNGNGQSNGAALTPSQIDLDELRVLALVIAYRNRGHLKSTTNPIKKRKDRQPFLDLKDFSLAEANLVKRVYGWQRDRS